MSWFNFAQVKLSPAIFASASPIIIAILQFAANYVPLFRWPDLIDLFGRDTRPHIKVFAKSEVAASDLHPYIDLYGNANIVLVMLFLVAASAFLFNLSCTGSMARLTWVALAILILDVGIALKFISSLWRRQINVAGGKTGKVYLWLAAALALAVSLADAGRQLDSRVCAPHSAPIPAAPVTNTSPAAGLSGVGQIGSVRTP